MLPIKTSALSFTVAAQGRLVLMVSSVAGKLRLPSVFNDTLLHNLKGNVGEREEREGTDNVQKSVDAYPNPSFSPANPAWP